MSEELDAAVTVFGQNEARHLAACLASIARAGAGLRLGVTVVINGSRDGSASVARAACAAHGLDARIATIAHGDKANAINHAIYGLRRPAALQVFVDGYAVISPESLGALGSALRDNPRAVAATGVAGNGRTMRAATEETLTKGGRLHGQLHALGLDFIERMVGQGVRLPVGLYRGDGLLGSMACHDLDAVGTPWDGHRIAGAAAATYMIPQLSLFRPADIARLARRKVRQMRGRLENAAIGQMVYAGGYAALPAFADDMIDAWLAAGGMPAATWAERPFMARALREQRRGTRPSAADLTPVLFARTEKQAVLF